MDTKEFQTISGTNKAYLLLLLLAIVFLAGGIAYLTMQKPAPKPPVTIMVPTVTPLPKEIIIKLTKTGFVPNSVTINTGSAIRWINESGEANATVNSTPHPINNDHKELNLGAFNGVTLGHIFTKAGTYGYHDYFHPDWQGVVIVQ